MQSEKSNRYFLVDFRLGSYDLVLHYLCSTPHGLKPSLITLERPDKTDN